MNCKLTLILLLLLLFPGIYAQTGNEIDWEYEIDLLARELAAKHPGLFFKTDSAWFFREMAQVASKTSGKTLFQVSVELQQVLAAMGDAQTQVNYHFLIDKSKILPFELYWFEDGICVLETGKQYEPALGKNLTAVNGFPLETVIDSLATLLVNDNQSVLKNSIPRMLTWYQLLEHFGFARNDELTLTFSGSPAETLHVALPCEPGEQVAVQPPSLPLGWQDQKSYFRDHYFENEHLYYIQYNRCWSREAEEDYGSGASALFMPSFKEFEKQVIPVLKKKDIDKLVFDLRFNGGGHSGQGTEFIRKICRSLPENKGEIFVLIGRSTREAAIINTVDFMKSTGVILVGEETAGTANHFGDVKRFVLPGSRLIISHPSTYYSLLEEDRPSIEPDLHTPMNFQQYMRGTDPALEAVRRYKQP